MNDEITASDPTMRVWGAVAAIAGLIGLISPAYLTYDFWRHPNWVASTAVPWFAAAMHNMSFVGSVMGLLLVGALLGWVRPASWRMLSSLMLCLPMVLTAINFLYDVARDPTSHNLWPFEFLLITFFILPARLGAYFGSRLGTWQRER